MNACMNLFLSLSFSCFLSSFCKQMLHTRHCAGCYVRKLRQDPCPQHPAPTWEGCRHYSNNYPNN
jgi:hypothetical protein